MALWKVENSLDLIVTALCLDYRRRQKAIEEKTVTKRTDTEYRYYNFKIYDAAYEIVGARYAEMYIDEIGLRTGFAQSALDCVSEKFYKEQKKRIKENIAKKLHLKD